MDSLNTHTTTGAFVLTTSHGTVYELVLAAGGENQVTRRPGSASSGLVGTGITQPLLAVGAIDDAGNRTEAIAIVGQSLYVDGLHHWWLSTPIVTIEGTDD